jgi:NAD(P)-dependent dehydrogenase (short-subunit alcohol dehydrogenase family)
MRAELKAMLQQGGGAIVNMASGSGLKGSPPMMSGYVSSKHGVVGLTRVAAIEYVKDGIRINAVAPGTVATPTMLGFPEEILTQYASVIPMGRMAEPSEIADAVAWLLSDQATFVTGIALPVDGGFLQK